VFLNHLGIPVADLSFDGPYGVYHSAYDNHNWVSRIGDPGFAYHAALVRLWGVAALRLANDPVIPLDVVAYADRIAKFVKDAQRSGPTSDDLRRSVAALSQAARAAGDEGAALAKSSDASAIADLNSRLMAFERAFIDPAGIPNRPWYRHQLFAPKFTYAAEVLPAVTEAAESGDPARLAEAQRQLGRALGRAAAALGPRASK
jgi:N-acetylated-alpha-linked acidic dipeptidase